MAFPNPKFEPPVHRWWPRAVAPSREVPSQICASFGPKTPIFRPKQPCNSLKTAKQRHTAAKLHVRRDFPLSKSRLVPFNSRICPSNGPKRRHKAPKSAECAPPARNQELAVSLATWLKTRFRGNLVHLQPRNFCGFHPSKSPKRTPRLPYKCALGCVQLQAPAETGGCPNGPTGSTGGKKMAVFKVAPRPRGMP